MLLLFVSETNLIPEEYSQSFWYAYTVMLEMHTFLFNNRKILGLI